MIFLRKESSAVEQRSLKDARSGVARFSRWTGGFSLVELLIAMAVGLVILAAMYSVFTVQNKTFGNQEEIASLQQSVRAGMDLMSREIGLAGYDPLRVNLDTNPANDFAGVTYNTSQLEIKADLRGATTNDPPDGVITPSSEEDIIYHYDAADKQIIRNSGSGDQPLIENVDSFNFDYLDGNGNVTTVNANIRRVRITIIGRTTKPDPSYAPNSGYRTYKLVTVITPRNLDF